MNKNAEHNVEEANRKYAALTTKLQAQGKHILYVRAARHRRATAGDLHDIPHTG